jgi:hypothetical protein
MDVTGESRVEGHQLPIGIHSRLNIEDPFDNFGLDFKSIVDHLSKGHVAFAGNAHSVSQAQPDPDFERFEPIDLLDSASRARDFSSPVSNDESKMSNSTQGRGQLVFLSGYPSPEQVARLTQAHGISPEFWRRHLDPILTTSASKFEDTKVPSAACNIFQLRVWTVGMRGNRIMSDKNNVESIRKDADVLMERYRDRLSRGTPWRTGDSIVRRYEVHTQEYFSIEQLLTVYLSPSKESSRDGNISKWLGEYFVNTHLVNADEPQSCCMFRLW